MPEGPRSKRSQTRKRARQENPLPDSEKPRSRYTEEEVELGLRALALCSGNSRKAAQVLQESDGPSVPAGTLYDWQTKVHADRYLEIQASEAPRMKARMAEQSEQLVETYARMELETAKKYEQALAHLDPEKARPKDISSAMRDLATGRGISTDKAASLRGEDQPQQPKLNYVVLVKQLERMGVVEGEAVEVSTPELEEGE